VSFGVVLLRCDGSVLPLTRRSERICNGDGLLLTAKGIRASGPQEKVLQRLLKDVSQPKLWPPLSEVAFVPRRDGSSLMLNVGPVPSCALNVYESLIAIFIHDPSRQPSCPEDVLRKISIAFERRMVIADGGNAARMRLSRFSAFCGKSNTSLGDVSGHITA
jgi:hypothetical protein